MNSQDRKKLIKAIAAGDASALQALTESEFTIEMWNCKHGLYIKEGTKRFLEAEQFHLYLKKHQNNKLILLSGDYDPKDYEQEAQ